MFGSTLVQDTLITEIVVYTMFKRNLTRTRSASLHCVIYINNSFRKKPKHLNRQAGYN